MIRVLVRIVLILCMPSLLASDFPVHKAALSDNLEKIQAHIQAHDNIDTKDASLMTPLHIAASKGNLAIVKALIAAHANINAQDIWNKTPLHWAAFHGCFHVVQELIRAHAAIDIQDTIQRTPLFCASYLGNRSIIRALIQAYAHINHQAYARITPLHCAVLNKQLSVVKTLVQAGASRTLTNNDGLTASQLAQDQTIIDYFNFVPVYAATLYAAVMSANIEYVRSLIDQGAPPLETDEQGETSIHKAIREYRKTQPTPYDQIARILIQTAGPQAIKVKNRKRQTPLHIAAMLGNVWMTLYLLRHGANPNKADAYGNTPLHYASSIRVRDTLLSHKANPTILNHEGQNPIAYTIQTWFDILCSQKKD